MNDEQTCTVLPYKEISALWTDMNSSEDSAVNDAMVHCKGMMNPSILEKYKVYYFNDKLLVSVKDKEEFGIHVFGADCFIEQFPDILTVGIPVTKLSDGSFYVVRDEMPINHTCFFTGDELLHMNVTVR